MSTKDRKAGYEAALVNAGDWLKGKMVGVVSEGSFILRRDTKLENGQYLFVASKEELAELAKGKVPK